MTLAPDLSKSTTILIIGAGPVGTAILLCLLAQGYSNVAFSEPSPEKRSLVTSLGATAAFDPFAADLASESRSFSKTDGVDIVFECSGVAVALDTAAACLRPKGTIVNVSVSSQPVSIGIFPMVLKEVSIKFSIAYTAKDFKAVIGAIEEGRLKSERLITKTIRLEDVVGEGLEVLHRKDNKECKILVDMSL